MTDNEKKPTYLEFEDPDDPESNAYESSKEKTSIKLTVQPEMFLVAIIEKSGGLAPDVLPAVRQLMDASYLQGKQVGQEIEKKKLADII